MYKNCIKAFILTIMIFLICFFIAISSFADYSITQLTDNDYNDYNPQINNIGEIVWYADEGNDDEIFYYDGTTIVQLTDNDYNDIFPQINNSGDVVWYGCPGNDGEIILAIFIGDSNGRGGSGWVISTAAYGFRTPKKSLGLALLFGFLLIGLSGFRKNFIK